MAWQECGAHMLSWQHAHSRTHSRKDVLQFQIRKKGQWRLDDQLHDWSPVQITLSLIARLTTNCFDPRFSLWNKAKKERDFDSTCCDKNFRILHHDSLQSAFIRNPLYVFYFWIFLLLCRYLRFCREIMQYYGMRKVVFFSKIRRAAMGHLSTMTGYRKVRKKVPHDRYIPVTYYSSV